MSGRAVNNDNTIRYYTISELSSEFDITTRTMRFYEEKGLLTPLRKGSTRYYSRKDRTKLKLILRGKRLGFTLEESRAVIDMYDPQGSNEYQLQTLLNAIQLKREQLEQQLDDIHMMMHDLDDASEKCIEAIQKKSKNKRLA